MITLHQNWLLGSLSSLRKVDAAKKQAGTGFLGANAYRPSSSNASVQIDHVRACAGAQINAGSHQNHPHSRSQLNIQPRHWNRWDKTSSSDLICSQSWLLHSHPATCDIHENETSEQDLVPHSPEQVKGNEKCFACCCQRRTRSIWAGQWWKQELLVDELWQWAFALKSPVLHCPPSIQDQLPKQLPWSVRHTHTHTHTHVEIRFR